jgi:nifR3 family TIM-barrel protein
MLRWNDEERPIGVQLFGGEPEVMAEAAKIVEAYQPDFIDLNLGCSVPKVVKTGAGSAVIKDLDQVGHLVRAVVKAVSVPVTVKTRKSWDSSEDPGAVEIAKIVEEAGASAITLHPRTAKQGFSGDADWSAIRKVKEAVSIPVIGSGDVKIPQDARRMLEETGCDLVMIGRAAIGNPWIFERTAQFLETGDLSPKPGISERVRAAIEHVREMTEFYGEDRALRDFRAHIGWYLKGLPGASVVRTEIVRHNYLNPVVEVLEKYLETSHETCG